MVSSNLSSSVSLGEMQVILSRSSSEMGSSLPPQSRITTFPRLCAYLAATRLRLIGISFCRRRQCDSSMTFLKSWSMSSRLENSMLAPPWITIEFYPYQSTQMQAMPVGTVSSIFHLRSTCACYISFLRRIMASSLPAWPMKVLLPASWPTETAWLAPLPPLAVMQRSDWMVSPLAGIFLTQRKQSALALPKTHILL